MEMIMIAAIILGPILAIQVEKYLEFRREDKQRKVNIFKTLMATRGSVLSYKHVEALNMIDLEFDYDKYENVVNAWKEYFDNLINKDHDGEEALKRWSEKNNELLTSLLYEMGSSLGYKFDKVLIRRNVYSPVGHAQHEEEQRSIRQGLLSILYGESSLPVYLGTDEESLKQQKELQKLMIAYYQNLQKQ